jgi:protein SCO1/2
VRFIFILILSVFIAACGSQSPKTTAEKHYPLAGKVVSLNAKEQTASIDAAAVPGYMDAMTMDYPIKSKAEFESLHPGDKISATLDVSEDATYAVSHIKIQGSGK